MSDLERIVVLAGGLSPEREVSLRSGDRVRDALAEAGIHAIVADADSALLVAAAVTVAAACTPKGVSPSKPRVRRRGGEPWGGNVNTREL